MEDWRRLNLREPTVRPRATEHMAGQIKAVEKLVERGHAYETEQGVYFSVESFPGYGALSGNEEAQSLQASGRDTVTDPEKRDPRDFALWKKDPDHLEISPPAEWQLPENHLRSSERSERTIHDLHSLWNSQRSPATDASLTASGPKAQGTHRLHVKCRDG